MTVPVLDEKDFASLSANSEIKKHLRWITPDHRGACGCYLLGLPVWLIAALWGGYALDRAGIYPGPWVLNALLLVALLLPLWPLFRVHRYLHRPVLDKLATMTGMDYASHDFELKAYDASGPFMLGEGVSPSFTEILLSKEGDGNAFAICHAEIEAGDGLPAYEGLFYWLKRRGKSAAFVTLLPADVAARFKLHAKAQRVEGIGDPALDAVFAVYADKPESATLLLGPELRQLLLGHAAHGPVYFHLGQNNVFLAAAPPANFEVPAGTARADRLRAIFDKVAAAFDVARTFRAQLDRL